MQIRLFPVLMCTIMMTFSFAGQAQVSNMAARHEEPSVILQTAESDTLLDILTLGAILVGSSSAAALLGAAVGAAATQSLCPSFGCSSSQETVQGQIDPIFPVGGALLGASLAGAFGAYVSGAITTLFFSSDGSTGE